ncbi:MAG: aminofutalosine synthase MqnE [Planctomycetota bacterium]
MSVGTMRDIEAKVRAGERLDGSDGLFLYRTEDLAGLRALADEVATAKNGDEVTYVVNRHINYSNLCTLNCFFCAFAKKRGDEDGYEFSLEQMLNRAREAVAAGATEVHMVGGLHPDYPYEWYPELLRTIRAECPSLTLKAFTAVELSYFAELSGRPLGDVLAELKEAGLGFVPGGGAEVLSDRIWKKLFRDKLSPTRWLEVHRAVHGAGLRSNATLLFGHIETEEEKVTHHLRIRELQDETGGFVSFIPLRFHPANTVLEHIEIADRDAVLREIAVARLMLDNVRHVKAYWIMTGLTAGRLALTGGADDFDGTVVEEKITHMAGAETPEEMTEESIRALIRGEGKTPKRRG